MTILKSKELTYYDILLNEKDISSIEDIVASVTKLIEGGESDSTSHLVLGSIDYGNNVELLEKYYSIENNEGYRQHVNEFTQAQTDAINRQLMSKNDPRMPISNNSRSKVTTGRPTHFDK